jgi:hypothetical protein
MKLRGRVASAFLVLALLAGCASTKVTDQTPMDKKELARPDQIYVYDFVVDAALIPADSAIRAQVSAPSKPFTAEELETGRALGGLIATNLAAEIRAMGLSAVRGGPVSTPRVGDGVIRGYLVSVQGGGAANRLVIGFGKGASELDTVMEAYVMTAEGLEKVGSGTLSASGSKTPGVVVPGAVALATGNPVGLIVIGGVKAYGELSGRNALEGRAKETAKAIAEQLKIRFRSRGWIS